MTNTKITIQNEIKAPIHKVWDYYNDPKHIIKWNSASPDWHTTTSTNDLKPGGKFSSRMEVKDGSMGFDFGGIYDKVDHHQLISYTMEDGRQTNITFKEEDQNTLVTIVFDAEASNPVEVQKGGWQAILDSFKRYTEKP